MEIENNVVEPLVIRSEGDAFRLVEKALAKQMGHDPCRLSFENWPVISIRLSGDGYDSTITPDMAAALVELQNAMNRSYALVVHGHGSARGLSVSERDDIKFKAKVDKGSSLIEINLGDWAEKIALELVSKMSPDHLVITVVSMAAVAGSTLAYKAYLRARSEDKKVQADLSARVAMSQEETKRLEVLSGALSAQPKIVMVRDEFDRARGEMMRGVADAESLAIDGVVLSNSEASAIARAKRSESIPVQLNGNYQILLVNWQQANEVKIKVKHAGSSREFYASFTDHGLSGEQIKLLQDAEWSRANVYLSINATELRGEVTTATVISVSAQPQASVG